MSCGRRLSYLDSHAKVSSSRGAARPSKQRHQQPAPARTKSTALRNAKVKVIGVGSVAAVVSAAVVSAAVLVSSAALVSAAVESAVVGVVSAAPAPALQYKLQTIRVPLST